MTPFYVKEYESGQKLNGPRNKMCRESHLRGSTNFPPITEYKRLTSPSPQRRLSLNERTPSNRPTTGAPPTNRPRSYSENSLGDLWSSSNGRSSLSFSSGDASTVASTERLWRRRKLSPRRVNNTRPVTPFPGEETSNNSPPSEVGNDVFFTPSPPQRKSNSKDGTRRRSTSCSIAEKQQPTAKEQITAGKVTSNCARRKVEGGLNKQPHPPTSQQQQDCETSRASERRRRKSMPDISQTPKADEARKTDSAETSEGRVVIEMIDRVTRQRIMNWLTEVAQAEDDDRDSLHEALSAIDEE